MKDYFGAASFLVAGAIVVAAQPGWAGTAVTQVTSVQTKLSGNGVQVMLETRDGHRPQVFSTIRGKSWVADVINTQLQLPGAMTYRQDNPAPGIASVEVFPLDANSIRVRVTGHASNPTGQMDRNGKGLLISLAAPGGSNAAGSSTQPSPTISVTRPTTPTPGPIAQSPSGTPTSPSGSPIQPVPANINPAPPFLPRAVAPPVGDIAVSSVDIAPNTIDLGTAERIPRLVLREAPVREVLSLLSRAAGLNIAFSESTAVGATPAGAPAAAASTTTTGGPTISLDIENEPVQDVFNYVLRLSGLQANRSGRTIFVGRVLPADARGLIMRTLRLNQLKADLPQVTQTTTVTSQSNIQSAASQGATNSNSAVGRTSTGTLTVPTRGALQLLQDMGATGPASAPGPAATSTTEQVLRGLQVTADSRTNTVTLIGPARLVDIATSYLTQLDIRKRQVAVNVKIIQVTLNSTDSLTSNFSFGIADSFFAVQGGALDANFGGLRPAPTGTTGVTPPIVPANTIIAGASTTSGAGPIQTINSFPSGNFDPQIFQYPRRFLLSLQASIQNQNAKVLTDPTLILQEGTTSQVNLTQQILTNLQQQIIVPTTGSPTVSLTTQFTDVGVILNVAVDQIDDNGFITMALSPEVSAPGNPIQIDLPGQGGGSVTNRVTPVNRRRLETGSVRLRDGQTLILTGIITEQDTVNATKVPILGDLPLIGALFRGTTRDNQRSEVVVLVTPQIMDDSQQSGFGYNYTPSPDVREMLERGRGSR